MPSFGYLYDYGPPNQHGVLPNGLLIVSSSVSGQGTVWRGYDPRSGKLTGMNITNVPGGVNAAGPSGRIPKIHSLKLRQFNTNPTGRWLNGTHLK